MTTDPFDLTGRTAIITGGTKGLGREIADVVLFLASPMAAYMSGAAVPVNGGGEGPTYLNVATGDAARMRQAPS